MVRLREDGGDQALAERVVQGVVNRRDADTQTPGGIAVDHDIGLQALVLIVAHHIGQLRYLAQPFGQARRPQAECLGVGVLQGELVLGAADAVVNRQVLRRLEIERDLRHLARGVLQPAHHLVQRFAQVLRFQVDQHAPVVDGGVDAVDAGEGRQAFDRRVFEDHLAQRALALRHGAKRNVLRRFGDRLQQAGVLLREKSFRHDDIQQHREHQRAERDKQRGAFAIEHPVEQYAVAANQAVKPLARCTQQRRLFGGVVAAQHARA